MTRQDTNTPLQRGSMTIGDKVGGVYVGDRGIEFGSTAPDFPKKIFLDKKPRVTVFGMAPVGVGVEIWHGGRRYVVKACNPGVETDGFGNIFHGWRIEGEGN